MKKSFLAALAMTGVLYACGDGGTGPEETRFTITAQTNKIQYAARNTTIMEPLQAIVVDPVSKVPQSNVSVTWRVLVGDATVVASVTATDANGVARGFVKASNFLTTSTVEATIAKLEGPPARFTVRSVERPRITAIAPMTARAGDTITVTGEHFSPDALDNAVVFGGVPGNTISATQTQMRAVVPSTVPVGAVYVKAMLGPVTGDSIQLTITPAAASVK